LEHLNMNQLDLITGAAEHQVFDFHADPGHGWLTVDMEQLKRLGIADKISAYSYVSRDRRLAYLEEDCDAGRFLEALKATGTAYQIKSHHSNSDSFIRRLPGYPAQPRLVA
jgi:hypothetical protein